MSRPPSTSASRLLALSSLVLVAVAVPGGRVGGQTTRPQLTTDVRVSDDDLAPARAYTSPQLAVHPLRPNVIVAAAADLRTRACRLFRSMDTGRSWTLLEAPATSKDFPYCTTDSGNATQSPIAFGRTGTLYYAMQGWGAQEQTGCEACGVAGNMSVVLARSDDLGDSYSITVVRDARTFTGTEVERNRPLTAVAVDTTTGDQDIVYVGWRRDYPRKQVTAGPVIAVSMDGGRTFGEPINPLKSYIPEAPEFRSFKPDLVVGANGTLYAQMAADRPGDEPTRPVLAKSTDHGTTFTVTEVGPASKYFPQHGLAWSPGGGPEGTLHLVVEDKVDPRPAAGDRDILYRRSTDGGRTFSEGVRLNDDNQAQGFLQLLPAVSAATNGRVDVAWWDFRNDPGLFANDVYYAYSEDNGVTWSKNIRASDTSSSRHIGTWANNFDLKAPPGILSTDQFALLGWEDTRLGDSVSQSQDVFATTAQFEPLVEERSTGGAYAVAAAGGLVLAGLILLATRGVQRRREPTRRAAAAAAAPSPERAGTR